MGYSKTLAKHPVFEASYLKDLINVLDLVVPDVSRADNELLQVLASVLLDEPAGLLLKNLIWVSTLGKPNYLLNVPIMVT